VFGRGELSTEVPTIDGEKGKVRLLTLSDLDRRTSAARRARDLISSINEDLGGEDRLATGERQIAQRAALLGTLAEDIEARWLRGEPIDPAMLCTISNAQRRLFEAIGIQRRPRELNPRLKDYLAEAHAESEAS
jgi:hypothetical protein